jgi:phage FluMu gp28-like protein
MMSDILLALDPVETFRRAFGLEELPWQKQYLREHRSVVLAKGRQIGATQACAARAIYDCAIQANALVVIVSPSLKQSTEITTRARQGLERLGERLPQDSASLLRMANGSRIMSLPGSPRSVRGWAATTLILDEAAYLDPETWVAAQALVAATHGRIIVQSTPADDAGPFHNLWMNTPASWSRMQVRSDEVSLIDSAWLEDQRMQMSEVDYQREYEAIFPEAGTGGFFNPAALARMTVEVDEPMFERLAKIERVGTV